MRTNLRLTTLSLSVSLLLAACGGGGGSTTTSPASATETPSTGGNTTGNTAGNTTGTNTPPSTNGLAPLPAPVAASASMLMSCPDTPAAGSTAQCSGGSIVRANENGVTLTSSGVQVYGMSTSDLKTPNAHPETATGFKPASGGFTEARVSKDANFVVSKPALLLSNLGIKWDAVHESPQIVETFDPTQGRVNLGANGQILPDTLHPNTDTAWYDFLTKGAGATQSHYANNRYFPRADPSRCPTGITPCPTQETTGVVLTAGDWRTTGTEPDMASGSRLHEDGDVHAGDGVTGATGPGVPFPGSKGYRDFSNASYRYANLTKWVSQDTTEIAEWANTNNEHNQNRRGIIAFGAVSDPSKIPAAGSANYSGWVRGWYTPNDSTEPTSFLAEASVTVDFSKRQVTITVANARTETATPSAVPVSFTATVGMGAANTSVANYLNGTIAAGSLKGGIGGRYFGPSDANTPSPEIGASFSMTDATTSASAIGGFIALKR